MILFIPCPDYFPSIAQPDESQQRVEEALELVQQLYDELGRSPMICNLLGALFMRLGKWSDAAAILRLSRDEAIRDGIRVPAETYMNAINCLAHLDRPVALLDKLTSEFREHYPNHTYFVTQAKLAQTIDRYAQTLSSM